MQGDIQVETIESLLKILGANFRGLILHTDHGSWKDKPKWQAKANQHVAKFNRAIRGNTPEEALKNLITELKKANRL